MRITERRLRQIIRETLLQEDTEVQQNDAEHRSLEAQPVQDDNLMSKGDATYEAFIKKHPAAQAGIDSVFTTFETARQNRLRYLRSSFSERYDALQKKLNTGTSVDVEKLKQAMISRVESTKLKMGTYGSGIKANHANNFYTPLKDPTSGWVKDLTRAGFADMASADEYHVIAYAPQSEALVVTEPPILKISAAGEVEAAIPNKNILSTLEHELIHQEDHSADALLGIPEYGKTRSGIGGAAEFATRLIRQAAVPKDQMTLDFIYNRLGADNMTISIVSVAEASGFLLDEEGVLFPTAAIAIAMYSDLLNGYPIPYNIFYYALERSLGKSLQSLVPGSEEYNKFSKILSQGSGKPGYKLSMLMRDYQQDTHLRITLSLLLPHLQQALSESIDPPTVIEAALTSMRAANNGNDVNRAAFILAITDPTKLRDLTLVAMGTAPTKSTAPGDETTQTALAERWTRLAGLVG